MHVTINFHDSDTLTAEEVVRNMQNLLGKGASVTVQPDSFAPHDLIHFGIQQIITHKQLEYFFDRNYKYNECIKALRKETIQKLTELLDDVIIENEAKVAK